MNNVTICYHSNAFMNEEDGNVLLKKHWGTYFDEMADSLNLSIISAFDSKKAEFQDYRIKKDSINFLVLREKGIMGRFYDRVRAFLKTFRGTDLYYILMPSDTGLLIAFLCSISKKNFGLYYGLEPFRKEDSWLKKEVTKMILRRSHFTIGTGDQVVSELQTKSQNVVKTKPNILFSSTDILERDFNGDALNLVFVGQISDRKGVKYLIQAVHQLSDNPQFENLKIVGEGPALSEIKELVEQLKLSNKVEFCGYLSDKEDIKRVYLDSNVLILPSFEEGFPRVLYEAMIFGLIIVTTPVNSVPSIIKDSVNGFYIKPGSVESISNVLNGIMMNDFNGNQMLQNNRRKLTRLIEFSAVKQHVDVIKNTI